MRKVYQGFSLKISCLIHFTGLLVVTGQCIQFVLFCFSHNLRHEGHIFFIYNHTKKTEEDDPKDAILYFYPGFVGVDVQIALVGGIIGLVDFCLEFLPRSMPSLVKLSGRNFALLQHEDFIIGLGGSPDTPDAFLIAHMQFVWSTFILYQGSLSALKKRVSTDHFLQELKNVWDYYLPLRQIQEDALSQAFQVLPYVPLHKSQGHLFLHASHILQRSLAHKGVLAGALFNKTRVLCTQLSNSLTRQFLLLMSQSQFPCVEANSVLELPGGVRLLHIYLPKNEYAKLGYRRKKAYIHSKSNVLSKERSSSDSVNRSTHPSLCTPDYISAQNFFTDGVVSSAGGVTDPGKSQSFDDGSSGNRSSSGHEASGLMVSPSAGLNSGTDSEVFLDTLSDMIFDSENQLKLADIKQVECATSSREASNLRLRQTLPFSHPTLVEVGSRSSLSLESNNPSLSQDSISPSPSQDSSSPLPSQDSSRPSPIQDSSSLSSRQGKNSPIPTQNSNSLIRDSSSPNSNSSVQSNNNQGSSSTSPTPESNSPGVNQNRSNPISGSHNPSPSQHNSNPSLSQDINNHTPTHNKNSQSHSENSTQIKINIHVEHDSGTSKAEENKAQLEIHQSLRDLSFSGKTPEEAFSHDAETPAEALGSFSDTYQHDTSSSDPTSNASNYDTFCTDTNRFEDSDSNRESTLLKDARKQDTSFADIKSKDISCADIVSHENNSVLQDKILNTELHLNQHSNKSNPNESVLAVDQEHCNGMESSAHEVTADLKSVAVFAHNYPDLLDSSETSTTSSHLDNSLSSDQQQNKEGSKVNTVEDGLATISPCHDNSNTTGPDSGQVNTISSFQNGRVTSQVNLHNKDTTSLLELEPVELNKIAQANGEIVSQLRKSNYIAENSVEDPLTSLNIKDKSERGVPVNKKIDEAHIGIENGLSDSADMSVSDLANKDSRSQMSLQPSGLSKQTTFNVTEILAQNKEQIDASLETRLSGDESSTQSSSELKHDEHEVSSYSLAYSEVGANKDRLTFEFVDSEFSEGGLLSPLSLHLSPVTESSGPTADDMPQGRSGLEPKSGDSKIASDLKSEDFAKSSPEWSPERDGLEELTLYAQGHSDTLLVLLVSDTVKWNKLSINSLWKSCLPHLAELDFQVKDAERHAKDESENVGAQHQYLKYDTFSQNLKGSALLPVTSLANEIVDSSIRMHDSFCSMPDLQEITYRSHSACCYGQRMVNTETYFQIGLPRMSAGICPPNDKTFCLDQMAEKILQNDK
ncbi:unnamed protein product [Candidula unifasciata]|uniref:CCZ1/INTU/HSP4 first Longin domain-containing protein n=1 Tax=Candidula unifasciata TaxID=100452 RepID=A0A8S4A8T3_9EUPU|nr:unnamed protein product [Candidula unifasciata]